MDNSEINIKLTSAEIKEALQGKIAEKIQASLLKNSESIEKSLDEYFSKGFFQNKKTEFESALDWAIEVEFRKAFEGVLEKMNFKEMVAEKTTEILKNTDFIATLAEAKVRSSLGLPAITKEN